MADVDHEGIDPLFQNDLDIALAVVTSGSSVRKRQHMDRIITILSSEQCGVFRSFDLPAYVEAMKLLQKYVYFLDLTSAGDRLKRLEECNQTAPGR
jgi:hypothetical protein